MILKRKTYFCVPQKENDMGLECLLKGSFTAVITQILLFLIVAKIKRNWTPKMFIVCNRKEKNGK